MLLVVAGAIQYSLPNSWIQYDYEAVKDELTEAKASIRALRMIPFQRRWAEDLQTVELKAEVFATSAIEGAEFVGDELEDVFRAAGPEELKTRSQKQASAALRTYQWIRKIPDDRPVTTNLIRNIHRKIVTGCDDDHCGPGLLRTTDQNVTFGWPRHRGVLGGKHCKEALERLVRAVSTSFRDHDLLVQAIATHYHLAAMHPFLDGNGRTARAIAAVMMQRAGLQDVHSVPMSIYYYQNKDEYLSTLSKVREKRHDLTPFLKFALQGVEAQASRLATALGRAVQKEVFRIFLGELFVRVESTRKRVILERQLMLLNCLLDQGRATPLRELMARLNRQYTSRKDPFGAMARDVGRLIALGAVRIESLGENGIPSIVVAVNLDWPRTLTDTQFFERLKRLPKSTTYRSLKSRN